MPERSEFDRMKNSGKGKWHTLFRVIGMDRDQFPLHKHNGII